ncbi:MAG TPA: NADH-quinone oxidoreductase subunit G, partial [Rhodospirillales bacterium]|nr:NADH-quinone oxidoreductase subunit G [Rhodospirillales bacterium]
GRVQRGNLAVFPPGQAREDWAILRALSAVIGDPLPYDDLAQVRSRMAAINPVFDGDDEIRTTAWGDFGQRGQPQAGGFASPVDNFYMTDPISRASVTMANCTRALLDDNQGKTGTDG